MADVPAFRDGQATPFYFGYEQSLLVGYVEKAGTPEGRSKALADVFWVLLNGSEFALNH